MYTPLDYLRRGTQLANNFLRPSHKTISTLMLYATDLCDSRCKHCLIWQKRPVEHLPKEKIIEILQSKCVTRFTNVGLEGGEFLLHPEANAILEWLSKNHPNFDLLTNCLKPQKVIDAVTSYPPQRLYLSLDGAKETYLAMRGKDGYDKVIEVIEACKDIVPISLMFTLTPYNNFEDLQHVIDLTKKYGLDVRIGIYNNMHFFDTVERAHQTQLGLIKNDFEGDFVSAIPKSVKDTSENYDFLVLYDEWRKKNLKMKCFSIMDSIVIHPDGSVPICQNLGLKLGNVHESTLDQIINSKESQRIQKQYSRTCNECWINFHRKYDIVMLRTLEKVLPKWLIEVFYGKYSWTNDPRMTYKKLMRKHNGC